jgi:hypothetical protein
MNYNKLMKSKTMPEEVKNHLDYAFKIEELFFNKAINKAKAEDLRNDLHQDLTPCNGLREHIDRLTQKAKENPNTLI